MELFDKLKNAWNGEEPEFEEEDSFEDDDAAEEVAPTRMRKEKILNKKKAKAKEQDREPASASYHSKESEYTSSFPFESRYNSYKTTPSHLSKVVDIHTTAKLQVVLTKPEKFSDAKEIADDLNEKRTIVLNLESTNKDEALRLLDFLSGVAYANDGEIKKIAKSTFIITPYNVDVMGDLLYELESNGVFFV